MAVPKPSFTVGVEEEYLLVDPSTRDLMAEPPRELWDDARERLGARVAPELLRAQIEIGTHPHETIAGLAADLLDLRRTVSDAARRHGAAIIAASTHPFARWWEQQPTEEDRYQSLAQDLGAVGRRMVICGMHVHVAVEDPELRIDLMNQVAYFLPHLLALSCSSPFWGGHDTGLSSYRLNVFRTLPRTGLPEHFTSHAEYQRHVDVLVDAGIIEDASKVWWDVRPSVRYPTLEMRVSDICTNWEDAISIAVLYRCILHMLFRLRRDNQRWRTYANMLVSENIWRAQRYGVRGTLMDYGKSELVPFPDLVEELVGILMQDAEELDCVGELTRAITIAREGTSADRQRARYEAATEAGASQTEALQSVVDELMVDTLAGT
jgi:carboxylate-amine ligase